MTITIWSWAEWCIDGEPDCDCMGERCSMMFTLEIKTDNDAFQGGRVL